MRDHFFREKLSLKKIIIKVLLFLNMMEEAGIQI